MFALQSVCSELSWLKLHSILLLWKEARDPAAALPCATVGQYCWACWLALCRLLNCSGYTKERKGGEREIPHHVVHLHRETPTPKKIMKWSSLQDLLGPLLNPPVNLRTSSCQYLSPLCVFCTSGFLYVIFKKKSYVYSVQGIFSFEKISIFHSEHILTLLFSEQSCFLMRT